MSRTTKILTIALIILVLNNCGNVHNNLKSEAKDSYDFTHQTSDLKPDASVIYGKLDNGLRYAIMANQTPSNTAALHVRIATGSLNETEQYLGLAHYLEHMAFNGSKNIPEGEMVKRLERFGLSFGSDTNAHTGFDETVYKLNLPVVNEDIINETMMIMRETVENISFNPVAIDRERGIIQSEKRDRDTPNYRAYLHFSRFMSQGSLLLKRLPIGEDSTLLNIDKPAFEDYYKAYYRPENTLVTIVGDIDPEYAKNKIEEFFADWSATAQAGIINTAGSADDKSEGSIGYFHDSASKTEITIATHKPFVKEKDNVSKRKKDVIDQLGNSILKRRLETLSKKADAKFLTFNIHKPSTFRTYQSSMLHLTSSPENWQQALAVGEQEIRKVLLFGFDAQELDEQIIRKRKFLKARAEYSDTRATKILIKSLRKSITKEKVFVHPNTSLEMFEEYADNITTDMVYAAFKKQWSGIDKPVLYLKTSVLLNNPEEQISQAFQNSHSIALQANPVRTIQKFAYTDFGKVGKVVSEKFIADIDTTLIKFDNNVLLNFKHTKFEKGIVDIVVKVGDGALSIPAKSEPLRRLAYNLVQFGGFHEHTVDEVESIMADKFTNLRFKIIHDDLAFLFQGYTVSEDIADQLNYMTAFITASAYRDEARINYLKSLKSWYVTHDSTPAGAAEREVPRLIRSGDKRFGFDSFASFEEPTIDEVKAWIQPQLAHGQIEISVVGDIDKATIVKQIARTFGSLPKRNLGYGTYPNMTKLKFPKQNKEPITITHTGNSNQALLQMYWPAPDAQDIKVTREVSVLMSIFKRKLIEVIREELAAAYSPSVSGYNSDVFDEYGYIVAKISLAPEMIPAITKKINAVAEEIRQFNITEDEFNRAIQPILAREKKQLESNYYWLEVIANLQTDDKELGYYHSREAAFKDMKLVDLQPHAAKIFKADKTFVVQTFPEVDD